MRSGTLPAPLVVGLGAACEISQREMARDYEHTVRLSKRLLDGINTGLTHVVSGITHVARPERHWIDVDIRTSRFGEVLSLNRSLVGLH